MDTLPAPLTESQVIDALGGTGAVAALLGVKATAVSNWRRTGIAWRLKPTVERICKERGIPYELPTPDLMP